MSNQKVTEKIYSVKSILIKNCLNNRNNLLDILLSHIEKDPYVDNEGYYDIEEVIKFDRKESKIIENYILEFASIYDIKKELCKTIAYKGSTVLTQKEVKFIEVINRDNFEWMLDMIKTSGLIYKPAISKEELSGIINVVFSEANMRNSMRHSVINTLGSHINIDTFSSCRGLVKKLKILTERINNKMPDEVIYMEKVYV